MTDAPKRLCFVNCGLPADQCECYRDIMQERADLIDMAVLRRVEAAFRRAVDDLHEWAACKDALEKAGFNVDDTQNRAEHGDAALADLRAMMEKMK